MGYLNNTTVTVDAILTKKGRELLAQGGNAFNITQFALADDEIDYDLWNQNHPLGDAKMGVVIENLPITEAVPDETQSMKYKLITLDAGTQSIPYLEVTPTSVTLIVGSGTQSIPSQAMTVLTKQWSSSPGVPIPQGPYTVQLLDTTYLDISEIGAGRVSGLSKTWSNVTSTPLVTLKAAYDSTTFSTPKSTKVIITHNIYGSRVVIPVTIQAVA